MAELAEVDIDDLLKRANGGDAKAAGAIRRHYKDRPDQFIALVRPLSEISRRTILDGLQRVAKDKNAIFTECTLEAVRGMAAELAGPDPNPIERLLADRCATCWLDAHVADCMSAGLVHPTPYVEAAAERRRSRAHDRLLKAFKALAHVRRVNLHLLLQINSGPVATIVGPHPAAVSPIGDT